jgi:hypothetical protein
MNFFYFNPDFSFDFPLYDELIVTVSKNETGLLIGNVSKEQVTWCKEPYLPNVDINAGNFEQENKRVNAHLDKYGIHKKEATTPFEDVLFLLKEFEAKEYSRLPAVSCFFRDGFKKILDTPKGTILIILPEIVYDRF